MKSAFLSLALALLIANPALCRAELELVATPLPQSSPNEIRRLLSSPIILRSQSVFSPNEAGALAEFGSPALGLTQKITVGDATAVGALKELVSSEGLRIELAPAELPIRAEGLDSEQWGLSNDGRAQRTPIDDISSVTLPGKADEDIGIKRAKAEAPSRAPILVAVLDTGVDTNHPNLRSRVIRKPEECAALDSYKACLKSEPKNTCDRKWSSIDSDGNGYPLDCSGWNLTVGKNPLTGIQGNGNTTDEIGHGTHIAGLIAAQPGDLGLRGVSANAMILPVKVLTSSPKGPIRPQGDDSIPSPQENGKKWDTGFADIIARGMLYAIRSGARVVNLSLAWPASADSELMRSMIRLAQARGIVIVAAAGNDATEAPVLPCTYDGVLCVAAHGPDGMLTRFSNFGGGVDLAAPGINILSTWPLSLRPTRFTDFLGFEFKNGTSMAAPFVAGAVARLLAEGESPETTYARLLLGARSRTSDSKATRFGNLDLARSLEIAAQPLILPKSKQTLRLYWDRVSGTLPLRFALKNVFYQAGGVRVQAQISGRAAQFADLSLTEWSIDNWAEMETREFETALLIPDPQTTRIPSLLSLTIRITAAGGPPREFTLKAEIIVPISTDSKESSFPIRGGTIPTDSSIRTVIPADPSSLSAFGEFAAVQKDSAAWHLFLLSPEETAYTIRTELALPASKGELLSLYRLDWNQDGKDEYALAFTIPHPQGKKNIAFRFEFLNGDFQPVKRMDYPSDAALIPENFQWLETPEGLMPSWVTAGFTPPLEKDTRYNPWNPNPTDTPGLKFYYLTQEGLHTVAAPSEHVFVTTLPVRKPGEVHVLLARGSSYNLSYSTAVVRRSNGKLVCDSVVPLKLEHFRMLVTNDGSLPIYSLERGGSSFAGSAFPAAGTRGNLRTSFLLPDRSMLDSIQRPISGADSVLRLAGAFRGSDTAAVFVQTQYDLQFHDLVVNQSAGTSMKRFSFIPQLSFLRSFVPAIVDDQRSGLRLPGMLVFGDLSGSETSEVIVPAYEEGKLVGLESPARLKLEAQAGCKRIGNPAQADAQNPTQILFFCGDRMIKVPQTY